MKTKLAFLLYAFTLIMMPRLCLAQSITINSVSATQFCAADPVSVTFTASSGWGHKNAFTLQLSDKTGSFTSFTNIGSVQDTIGGTITINSAIPSDALVSIHYRLRVIGAIPYTPSTDNGTDLVINPKPNISFTFSTPAITIGDSVQIVNRTSGAVSYLWDFGDGASPATSTDMNPVVYYSTEGIKKISLTATSAAGCSVKRTVGSGPDSSFGGLNTVTVYTCNPVIPKNAIVVESDSSCVGMGFTYWVNPGVTFQLIGGSGTIFAESGSTIERDGGMSTIYLKAGVSYKQGGGGHTVIYDIGASLTSSGGGLTTATCPSLSFDYHVAPPNKAFPKGSVNKGSISTQICISPNPASEKLTITGIPERTENVSLISVLGNTLMQITPPNTETLTIDVSKLQKGTYYLRVVSVDGVATKKFVKR
jgi:PKD repeat protein